MPTSTQSIREIVTTQPSAVKILQHFDIDLCSQADESLKQACAELQLSVDQVLEKLADDEAKGPGATPADPASLPMGRLIQHIVRVHHQCVRKEMPRLAEMAHKVLAKRGDRAPELKKVETLLEQLRTGLFNHIQKEEQVLFPFISQMDQNAGAGFAPAHACFGSVAQPILMMMREHDCAEHTVAELHHLTGGYEPPTWACVTHIELYAGLRSFHADLKQHVHLENDVLFPRAIAMEGTVSHGR